jgi:YbbR domain-containing protein
MSWLLDDLRLKLLALLLAVLMLGAVAFAQNPSTTRTFHPPVNYTLPTGLVILNPQRSVPATVTGLSDTISTMTDNSLTATVDASKATPGPAVKLNIVIVSLVPNVRVPNNIVPIALNIDVRATEDLPVQVITHPVAGWSVTRAIALCGSTTQPCVVHFDGPQSLEKAANLTASVNYTTPIQATNYASDNWAVQLRNSSGVIDPLACNTSPPCGLDVSTVSVEVQAQAGSTSTTVPLIDAPPSQGPPSGYRVSGVAINPVIVNISGDPTVLAKIQRITLPALDLSSSTSTVSFIVNIPVPDGVSIIGPSSQAKITYTIQKNPNASASP